MSDAEARGVGTVDDDVPRSPGPDRRRPQPWLRRDEREQRLHPGRRPPPAVLPGPDAASRRPAPPRRSGPAPERPADASGGGTGFRPASGSGRAGEPEPYRPGPGVGTGRPGGPRPAGWSGRTGGPPADGDPRPPRGPAPRGEPRPATGDRESARRPERAPRSAPRSRSAARPPAAPRPPLPLARPAPDHHRRTLGQALLAAAAATIAPGSGHLMLGRRRSGLLILGVFAAAVVAVLALVLLVPRSDLVQSLISTRVLIAGAIGCLLVGLAWIGVIVGTYRIGRPDGLDPGRRAVGALTVTALCLLVAAPLGFGANLANSQRDLLDTLFTGGGGTAAAEAIAKPRLNILLVGSDAGPDRTGTRTDTMMVASIDTRSGRTTLFGLPRNIGHAQFPPGSPMAREFPQGFHDRSDPTSGNYLLNAVYAYGHRFPALAPTGPTADPGLNLLHQTVAYMLGLQIDYYTEVDMAGFASLIDALGGLRVDVGPERIPIGGITPSGRLVRPDGYIEPGVQQLSGEQALAFARSRTNSSDYARMGRQRCLVQNILSQKSPADLLANFRSVAAATTDSVSTNIPQQVLPGLVRLAGAGTLTLESVSFDPDLPDPGEDDGRFDTGRPDFPYIRTVVQGALARAAPAPPVVTTAPRIPVDDADPDDTLRPSADPTSLAAACG